MFERIKAAWNARQEERQFHYVGKFIVPVTVTSIFHRKPEEYKAVVYLETNSLGQRRAIVGEDEEALLDYAPVKAWLDGRSIDEIREMVG